MSRRNEKGFCPHAYHPFAFRNWDNIRIDLGFQGYAPDTDLDNVRNRVVGILFGLIVTGLVFQYIWPERARIESRES